jgi:hypothetical protein
MFIARDTRIAFAPVGAISATTLHSAGVPNSLVNTGYKHKAPTAH